MGGEPPKAPKVKPPPPPANPPTLANPAVGAAGSQATARAKGGMGSTIATGPQGLTAAPPTAPASLLGGTV